MTTTPYFDTVTETVVEVVPPHEGEPRYFVSDLPYDFAPDGYYGSELFHHRFKPLMVEVPYELVVAVRRVVYAQEQRGTYPYPTPVDAAVERLAELAKDVEWPEEWTT